jgi:hypothetical protein
MLAAGYEVRFQSALKKWKDIIEEEERIKQHYQAIIFDHKARYLPLSYLWHLCLGFAC